MRPLLSLALIAASAAPLFAQLPTPALPPHYALEVVATGFEGPTDFVSLPGGRLLVAQQDGTVRGIGPGNTPMGVVVSLWSEVSSFADRGLVAIEVHPGFVPDGGPTSWLYLYYAVGPDQLNGQNGESSFGRLTRYRIHEVLENGALVLRAIPSSRQILLGDRQSDGLAPTAIPILHESHQGGSLVFGSDGSLLLSTGDGADIFQADFGGLHPYGFEDFVNPATGLKGPLAKSQDVGSFRSVYLNSLAGKVLRIDPETGLGLDSNPFFDGDPASLTSRVWALGLRNAFRMSLIPGTGARDMSAGDPGWFVIADVGSTTYEELDVCKGGENFGWPCFEGVKSNDFATAHVHQPNPYGWPRCSSVPAPHTPPFLAIRRDDPLGLEPLAAHQTFDGAPLQGFLGICVIGGGFVQGSHYPLALQNRYLFFDFGFEWLKAAALDGTGQLQTVSDLGEMFATPVALRTEADTGDVLIAQRGYFPGSSRVVALRYGVNQLPAAEFSFQAIAAQGGLAFLFDASATTDGDGDPLVFRWNFGDGSDPVEGVAVEHTFPAAGLYSVTLEVEDGFGAVSVAKNLLAGFEQPTVAITTPSQGAVFQPGDVLVLDGLGADGAGGALDLVWAIDIFVDGTWIQDALILPTKNTTLPFLNPGKDATDYGFRLRLVGLDDGVPVAEDRVYVHPAPRVVDVAGPALFEAKVLGLDPVGSQGFGNRDPEVWRDRLVPAGGGASDQQYATYHPLSGAAGAKDWIGYRFGPNHPPGARVFAVELTEGQHTSQGGWFKAPEVEVLLGGQWQLAADVEVEPPYLFDAPNEGFRSYTFRFAPVEAEGVRIIGRPGGALGFVSVSELRVFAVAAPGPIRDLTPLAAAPIASTLALSPPGPQGFGSADLGKLGDGAEPAPASTSQIAYVSSYHPADPGGPAWFGWRFDQAVTLSGARFREGMVSSAGDVPLGGWFQNLRAESRLSPQHPWEIVSNLEVNPPYRTAGPGTPDFEAFTLTFDPRVAREFRVIGGAGGSASFATASELRVFGPHGFDGGWFPRFGLGLETDLLQLVCTTPPVIGHPVLLEARGASPLVPGVLAFTPLPAQMPLAGGTLLVDLPSAFLLPMSFDATGTSNTLLDLPAQPALVGKFVSFQAFSIDFSLPGFLGHSNALDALFSPQ